MALLPRYQITIRPNHYAAADGAASNYRAGWIKHDSSTTGQDWSGTYPGTVDGRLILSPTSTHANAAAVGATKSWTWWFTWSVTIGTSWDHTQQGHWGRMFNWHNCPHDGGLGWNAGFGIGGSSLALDYEHGHLLWAVQHSNFAAAFEGGGPHHIMLIPNAPKGVRHDFIGEVILGRTDGSVSPSGHPNGGAGRVRIWVNGADTPISSGNCNTLQRAQNNGTGPFFVQTSFVLWEGFYTRLADSIALPFEIVAARFGTSIEQCLADVPVKTNHIMSNIYDGSGTNLGPTTFSTLSSFNTADFRVPPSLGGSEPPDLPENTGPWATAVQFTTTSTSRSRRRKLLGA